MPGVPESDITKQQQPKGVHFLVREPTAMGSLPNNNSINRDYSTRKVFGSCKYLVQENNKTINDRNYIIYGGMYYNKNKVLINTKVLYYKLKSKYLVIEVESIEDVNTILDEVTDIEIDK